MIERIDRKIEVEQRGNSKAIPAVSSQNMVQKWVVIRVY